MDYLVKLLFISGRFLTQVAGRTILQVYYKSVDIHKNLALKYYKVTQLAGTHENMLDLINTRVQEIGIHEGKLCACITDDIYTELDHCRSFPVNAQNLETFINIDLTKYISDKAKKRILNDLNGVDKREYASTFENPPKQVPEKAEVKHNTTHHIDEPCIVDQKFKSITISGVKYSSLSDVTKEESSKKEDVPTGSSEFEICKLIVSKKIKNHQNDAFCGNKKTKEDKKMEDGKVLNGLDKLPSALAGADVFDEKKPLQITDDNSKPILLGANSKDLLKLIQNKIKEEFEKQGFQDVLIPIDSKKIGAKKSFENVGSDKKVAPQVDSFKVKTTQDKENLTGAPKGMVQNARRTKKKGKERHLRSICKSCDAHIELVKNEKLKELARHNKEIVHFHHKSCSRGQQIEDYEFGNTNVELLEKELNAIEKLYKIKPEKMAQSILTPKKGKPTKSEGMEYCQEIKVEGKDVSPHTTKLCTNRKEPNKLSHNNHKLSKAVRVSEEATPSESEKGRAFLGLKKVLNDAINNKTEEKKKTCDNTLNIDGKNLRGKPKEVKGVTENCMVDMKMDESYVKTEEVKRLHLTESEDGLVKIIIPAEKTLEGNENVLNASKLVIANEKEFKKLERKITRKLLNRDKALSPNGSETEILIPQCTNHDLIKMPLQEDISMQTKLLQINEQAFSLMESRQANRAREDLLVLNKNIYNDLEVETQMLMPDVKIEKEHTYKGFDKVSSPNSDGIARKRYPFYNYNSPELESKSTFLCDLKSPPLGEDTRKMLAASRNALYDLEIETQLMFLEQELETQSLSEHPKGDKKKEENFFQSTKELLLQEINNSNQQKSEVKNIVLDEELAKEKIDNQMGDGSKLTVLTSAVIIEEINRALHKMSLNEEDDKGHPTAVEPNPSKERKLLLELNEDVFIDLDCRTKSKEENASFSKNKENKGKNNDPKDELNTHSMKTIKNTSNKKSPDQSDSKTFSAANYLINNLQKTNEHPKVTSTTTVKNDDLKKQVNVTMGKTSLQDFKTCDGENKFKESLEKGKFQRKHLQSVKYLDEESGSEDNFKSATDVTPFASREGVGEGSVKQMNVQQKTKSALNVLNGDGKFEQEAKISKDLFGFKEECGNQGVFSLENDVVDVLVEPFSKETFMKELQRTSVQVKTPLPKEHPSKTRPVLMEQMNRSLHKNSNSLEISDFNQKLTASFFGDVKRANYKDLIEQISCALKKDSSQRNIQKREMETKSLKVNMVGVKSVGGNCDFNKRSTHSTSCLDCELVLMEHISRLKTSPRKERLLTEAKNTTTSTSFYDIEMKGENFLEKALDKEGFNKNSTIMKPKLKLFEINVGRIPQGKNEESAERKLKEELIQAMASDSLIIEAIEIIERENLRPAPTSNNEVESQRNFLNDKSQRDSKFSNDVKSIVHVDTLPVKKENENELKKPNGCSREVIKVVAGDKKPEDSIKTTEKSEGDLALAMNSQPDDCEDSETLKKCYKQIMTESDSANEKNDVVMIPQMNTKFQADLKVKVEEMDEAQGVLGKILSAESSNYESSKHTEKDVMLEDTHKLIATENDTINEERSYEINVTQEEKPSKLKIIEECKQSLQAVNEKIEILKKSFKLRTPFDEAQEEEEAPVLMENLPSKEKDNHKQNEINNYKKAYIKDTNLSLIEHINKVLFKNSLDKSYIQTLKECRRYDAPKQEQDVGVKEKETNRNQGEMLVQDQHIWKKPCNENVFKHASEKQNSTYSALVTDARGSKDNIDIIENYNELQKSASDILIEHINKSLGKNSLDVNMLQNFLRPNEKQKMTMPKLNNGGETKAAANMNDFYGGGEDISAPGNVCPSKDLGPSNLGKENQQTIGMPLQKGKNASKTDNLDDHCQKSTQNSTADDKTPSVGKRQKFGKSLVKVEATDGKAEERLQAVKKCEGHAKVSDVIVGSNNVLMKQVEESHKLSKETKEGRKNNLTLNKEGAQSLETTNTIYFLDEINKTLLKDSRNAALLGLIKGFEGKTAEGGGSTPKTLVTQLFALFEKNIGHVLAGQNDTNTLLASTYYVSPKTHLVDLLRNTLSKDSTNDAMLNILIKDKSPIFSKIVNFTSANPEDQESTKMERKNVDNEGIMAPYDESNILINETTHAITRPCLKDGITGLNSKVDEDKNAAKKVQNVTCGDLERAFAKRNLLIKEIVTTLDRYWSSAQNKQNKNIEETKSTELKGDRSKLVEQSVKGDLLPCGITGNFLVEVLNKTLQKTCTSECKEEKEEDVQKSDDAPGEHIPGKSKITLFLEELEQSMSYDNAPPLQEHFMKIADYKKVDNLASCNLKLLEETPKGNVVAPDTNQKIIFNEKLTPLEEYLEKSDSVTKEAISVHDVSTKIDARGAVQESFKDNMTESSLVGNVVKTFVEGINKTLNKMPSSTLDDIKFILIQQAELFIEEINKTTNAESNTNKMEEAKGDLKAQHLDDKRLEKLALEINVTKQNLLKIQEPATETTFVKDVSDVLQQQKIETLERSATWKEKNEKKLETTAELFIDQLNKALHKTSLNFTDVANYCHKDKPVDNMLQIGKSLVTTTETFIEDINKSLSNNDIGGVNDLTGAKIKQMKIVTKPDLPMLFTDMEIDVQLLLSSIEEENPQTCKCFPACDLFCDVDLETHIIPSSTPEKSREFKNDRFKASYFFMRDTKSNRKYSTMDTCSHNDNDDLYKHLQITTNTIDDLESSINVMKSLLCESDDRLRPSHLKSTHNQEENSEDGEFSPLGEDSGNNNEQGWKKPDIYFSINKKVFEDLEKTVCIIKKQLLKEECLGLDAISKIDLKDLKKIKTVAISDEIFHDLEANIKKVVETLANLNVIYHLGDEVRSQANLLEVNKKVFDDFERNLKAIKLIRKMEGTNNDNNKSNGPSINLVENDLETERKFLITNQSAFEIFEKSLEMAIKAIEQNKEEKQDPKGVETKEKFPINIKEPIMKEQNIKIKENAEDKIDTSNLPCRSETSDKLIKPSSKSAPNKKHRTFQLRKVIEKINNKNKDIKKIMINYANKPTMYKLKQLNKLELDCNRALKQTGSRDVSLKRSESAILNLMLKKKAVKELMNKNEGQKEPPVNLKHDLGEVCSLSNEMNHLSKSSRKEQDQVAEAQALKNNNCLQDGKENGNENVNSREENIQPKAHELKLGENHVFDFEQDKTTSVNLEELKTDGRKSTTEDLNNTVIFKSAPEIVSIHPTIDLEHDKNNSINAEGSKENAKSDDTFVSSIKSKNTKLKNEKEVQVIYNCNASSKNVDELKSDADKNIPSAINLKIDVSQENANKTASSKETVEETIDSLFKNHDKKNAGAQTSKEANLDKEMLQGTKINASNKSKFEVCKCDNKQQETNEIKDEVKNLNKELDQKPLAINIFESSLNDKNNVPVEVKQMEVCCSRSNLKKEFLNSFTPQKSTIPKQSPKSNWTSDQQINIIDALLSGKQLQMKQRSVKTTAALRRETPLKKPAHKIKLDMDLQRSSDVDANIKKQKSAADPPPKYKSTTPEKQLKNVEQSQKVQTLQSITKRDASGSVDGNILEGMLQEMGIKVPEESINQVRVMQKHIEEMKKSEDLLEKLHFTNESPIVQVRADNKFIFATSANMTHLPKESQCYRPVKKGKFCQEGRKTYSDMPQNLNAQSNFITEMVSEFDINNVCMDTRTKRDELDLKLTMEPNLQGSIKKNHKKDGLARSSKLKFSGSSLQMANKKVGKKNGQESTDLAESKNTKVLFGLMVTSTPDLLRNHDKLGTHLQKEHKEAKKTREGNYKNQTFVEQGFNKGLNVSKLSTNVHSYNANTAGGENFQQENPVNLTTKSVPNLAEKNALKYRQDIAQNFKGKIAKSLNAPSFQTHLEETQESVASLTGRCKPKGIGESMKTEVALSSFKAKPFQPQHNLNPTNNGPPENLSFKSYPPNTFCMQEVIDHKNFPHSPQQECKENVQMLGQVEVKTYKENTVPDYVSPHDRQVHKVKPKIRTGSIAHQETGVLSQGNILVPLPEECLDKNQLENVATSSNPVSSANIILIPPNLDAAEIEKTLETVPEGAKAENLSPIVEINQRKRVYRIGNTKKIHVKPMRIPIIESKPVVVYRDPYGTNVHNLCVSTLKKPDKLRVLPTASLWTPFMKTSLPLEQQKEENNETETGKVVSAPKKYRYETKVVKPSVGQKLIKVTYLVEDKD